MMRLGELALGKVLQTGKIILSGGKDKDKDTDKDKEESAK